MSKSLGIAKGVVAELKAELRPLGFLSPQKKHLLGKLEWEPGCSFGRFGAASTCTENKSHTHKRAHTHAYCRRKINYVPDIQGLNFGP